MNKEKVEQLLGLLTPNLMCMDCPVGDYCDKLYGHNPPNEDDCYEMLRRYVNDEPMPKREYNITVCWQGTKTYTISAESREEAELLAIKEANINDVEYWDCDVCHS